MAIVHATKDNIINMTQNIHVYEEEVKLMKEKTTSLKEQVKEKKLRGSELEELKKCMEIHHKLYQVYHSFNLEIQKIQDHISTFNNYLGRGKIEKGRHGSNPRNNGGIISL